MRSRQRYQARFAATDEDLRRAQALRHLAFVTARGLPPKRDGLDTDAFDGICRHVLVEDASGDLAATFRFLPLTSGAEIGRSYSARYYDLAALAAYDRPMVEMGRFCLRPGPTDPDVLRCAWGAMTDFVDREGMGMLFGCSSFEGTDWSDYTDAFAMLRERHLAPKRWLPRIKATDVFRFSARLRRAPDRVRALKTMPPLLRSYLGMGGWVSDHAVVDRELGTLHVFTGLEVRRIPVSRAKLLRTLAA